MTADGPSNLALKLRRTRLAAYEGVVLIWASTAFELNMYALFSGDRDAVETIHEIKHAILDSTNRRYTPEVAFAETQWQMLNRSRLLPRRGAGTARLSGSPATGNMFSMGNKGASEPRRAT